ncbi:MAG: AmpG family muropeptide MFS transporter [Bdellovibrionota bacterium]
MKSVGQLFANRKMLFVFLLGFSSGLPIALTTGTLQAWLSDSEIDIKTIGLFALVGYPYTFKFAWSPLMDRFVPPFLGLRRGWMVLCQAGLILCIFAMGEVDPRSRLEVLALLAVCVAFLSASQDIVVDAYRAELLDKDELGTGTGLAITGYRIAMIVSGSVALILADHTTWTNVYRIMAATLGVGMLAAIAAPEPQFRRQSPKTLGEAVVQPIVEFFRRQGSLEILAFVILYKLGDVLALALQTKFMLSLEFTKSEIGYISKGLGLAMTIFGSIVGGALMDKLGMKRALIGFGIFQGLSILSFALLAEVGKSYPVMAGTIAFENLCSGFGNAAFVGYLMSLCNKRFTATQYALLSSLGAIPRVFLASRMGYVVELVGWTQFFLICTLAAAPGIVLVWLRFDSWERTDAATDGALN